MQTTNCSECVSNHHQKTDAYLARLNSYRLNVICFIYGTSKYRAINTYHHGYKYQSIMYTSKAAVCSEIRTKHSTQSQHHVEFF
jgi:hypothetical protein